MTLVLAYIDPGTGSMLFTIVTGFAIAAYFAAKTAWIRLRTLFAGRKAGLRPSVGGREKIVIYSEGKRYWNVFAPVVEELERRGISAAFLTSDQDDPVFGRGESSIRPQYIGAGNLAYARLNMLQAEVCLMTTPGLDVYQLKRSKGVGHYAHLLHAVDDATSYRLFGLDYFDSVLLSGEYQGAAIRELEAKRGLHAKELAVVGSTYLDAYAAKVAGLARPAAEGFTVLVSPSWGESGILQRYGLELLGPLAESGCRVIVRPHPQSSISEADEIARLKDALAGFELVEWDFAAENLASLSRADVMISDFSGIVFDYAFLFGRPVLYANKDFDRRPYDSSDVEAEPWKFAMLRKIGKELAREDFPRIGELARALRGDEAVVKAIAQARDEAWQGRGESGALVADFLVEKAGL
jgi:hypothetical protein